MKKNRSSILGLIGGLLMMDVPFDGNIHIGKRKVSTVKTYLPRNQWKKKKRRLQMTKTSRKNNRP